MPPASEYFLRSRFSIICIATAISSSKIGMNIQLLNSENILFYKKTEKCQNTGSKAPKKIKFRSGRQHQNIFCGPDSPLFALPQQSHLAKYEWLFHFLIVELYYSTRKKWKIAKPLVRRHLNKFKCRSGCQLKNICCAPDSPLFAFPRLSHQVKYEWIFHFLIGEIYYFTWKLKNAKTLVRRRLKNSSVKVAASFRIFSAVQILHYLHYDSYLI